MNRTKNIHKTFKRDEAFLDDIITHYETKGEDFGNQDRNSLKLFKLGENTLNVKSFRIPNVINQVAYRFFRKSKAQRSYEYAKWLQSLEIGTPQPVAYYEFKTALLFKNSYYISKQLECDLTYRELTKDLNYPNHEEILRAFTRFTFKLHEKKVNFLDHSPGNTLIKAIGADYEFYLVDLNRMEFKPLDFEARIKNFAKLTTHESIVRTMSDEYAKCVNRNADEVFNLMWKYTMDFQERYWRRRRIKNKLKFWKKK
ncbi:Lipopolysaccharide kinase (Kdo/WaaP) family protein [Formosa sp. Hel1_31_208]|uniref:lipopolysaccharide kinase InaA family protein n=1 Tax=Formosa sp. Hel1_31_208 TaxID=1798225 RepID=UPI00087A331C|nr:lipopolysaccharide kinase InaA family protein [Formosa sp. Hel1_31_208]SDS59383.1 Lipopolysaccharide kinase (Kdo/WaaP) family protein [Formosa sp. Hel1_31_208]